MTFIWLLSACCRLTDIEISSNLLLVLLAGHDTSSTTLTRCLSNLHDHPWVMDKLRAEQQAVQAKRGQAITVGALKDMPFADAVLRWVGHLSCCHGLPACAHTDVKNGSMQVQVLVSARCSARRVCRLG